MKVKLPDICTIQYGYPFDSKLFNESKGTPLIRIRDVKRGYSETYTTEEIPDGYLVRKGDMLIGMDGEFNIAKWGDMPAALNQRVCKIIPRDNIYPDYVYYALPIRLKDIEDRTAFATVKHLSAKVMNDIRIEVPCIEQQINIAKTLNKIVGVIKNRKRQLQELDTLVKARFVEMFGDMANPECQHPKYKLVETCRTMDDIKCGPFGTQLNKDEYQTEGIAVWEIPQINSGFIEKPIHFLTKKKAEQLKAYSIEPGDIAMSRKGNVGKCGLFPENYESGIIHSDVLRIRIDNNRFNPCFIMHQLHYSRAVQRQIQMVSSGAIMAGINVTKLKQIEVHIPPLELQNQFATFVQAVDKSKVAIQKSLDETQLLFDSLMQEYFG